MPKSLNTKEKIITTLIEKPKKKPKPIEKLFLEQIEIYISTIGSPKDAFFIGNQLFYDSKLDLGFQPQYKFHPIRRWRFDFAFIKKKIGIEIMGGVWIGGRHVTGSGFEKDSEKLNEAQLLGWKVFYFTSKMVKDGTAIDVLKRALNSE